MAEHAIFDFDVTKGGFEMTIDVWIMRITNDSMSGDDFDPQSKVGIFLRQKLNASKKGLLKTTQGKWHFSIAMGWVSVQNVLLKQVQVRDNHNCI